MPKKEIAHDTLVPRALKVQNVTYIPGSGGVFPLPHRGKNPIWRILAQSALILKGLANGQAIPSKKGVVAQLCPDP